MRKLKNIGGVNKIQPHHRQIFAITLFSGIGGTTLGYQWAKLVELLAVEWYQDAVDTLKLNFPDLDVWKKDISKLSGLELLERINMGIGQLDFFHASPPCQDFSRANPFSDCMSDRGILSLTTLQLIEVVQPKVFVMENVEALSNDKKNKRMWTKMVKYMQSMNYNIEFAVLNSANYAVPQARRRLIIIGVRNDIVNQFGKMEFFPKPTTACNPIAVKDVIPESKFFISGQKTSNMVLHRTSDICNTLTKTDSSMHIYKSNWTLRTLTIEEILKFSTFPEDYNFSKQTRQIVIDGCGNCVPPKLAQAIGEHVKNVILTPEVLAWCDNNLTKNAA